MPTINGTSGNDALTGTDGADEINGLAGDDTLDGGNGDDALDGGDGDDQLRGGEGNDVLDGGTGVNLMDGGAGDDVLDLGSSTDVWPNYNIAAGGSGADTITGSVGRDELYSGQQEDPDLGYFSFNPNFPEYYHVPTLDRGTEVDSISAGAGDDFVSIGYGDSADGGTHGEHGDTLFLSLVGSPTGITADFRQTTLTIGGATITGFEAVHYVEGSQFNDVFTFSPLPFPIEGFGDPSGGGREISGLGGNDRIIAGYYTNNIWGGDGNDFLDGRASQYLMFLDGGAGNDTLLGGGELHGGDGDDSVTGGGSWDKIFGGDGNDTLRGLGYDDEIQGGAGNDVLDGGEGLDRLYGGAGDDTYLVSDATDYAYEYAGEGYDRVVSSVSLTLRNEMEELTLTGAGALDGRGNESANVITGNSGSNGLEGLGGDDRLHGAEGDDDLEGGLGNDELDGDSGRDTASYATATAGVRVDLSLTSAQDTLGAGIDTLSSIENLAGSGHADELGGDAAANRLSGAGGDDRLYGGGGDDELNGGAGIDRLYGGIGNDSYIVTDATDYAYEEAGEGVDQVLASVTHALRANIENLTLTGSSSIHGEGNDLGNLITGNIGSNKLYGLGGDDRLYGGAGNDRLDGGTGLNRLYGGTGNDTYVLGNSTSYAYENAGEGTDRVYSSLTHTLRANIEYLYLTGTLWVNATGNELSNILSGNSGANILDGLDGNDRLYGGEGSDRLNGGAGSDRMYGGLGDDTYIVSDSTDYAIESAGQGNDRVYSSVTHTLRANVESLYLTGTLSVNAKGNELNNLLSGNSGANKLYGMDGNDRLYGGDGNDQLEGGAGSDQMYGGSGDDTYIVSDSTDYANEGAGQGNDRVYSSVDHSLRANIEALTLTGYADIDGTGNALDNVIRGNEGSNRLDGAAGNDLIYGGAGYDTIVGGAGADRMYGGSYDDTYYVDDSGDVVVELAGEGEDTVWASTDYTLAANVDWLRFEAGSAAITGVGNGLMNLISGNAQDNQLFGLGGDDEVSGGDGNDLIDGGTGADLMDGGAGDDTLIVDDMNDTAAGGSGIDTVLSSVSFTLAGWDAENLELTGTANIEAEGNLYDNLLTGNGGDNILKGFGGDDTLDGAAGNDQLDGGTGNDRLYGMEGNDVVSGADGEDVLDGGDGDDQLDGGSGRDFYNGGAGADTFVFGQGDFGGTTFLTSDVIQDFSAADGDRIDLSLADADATLDGDQSFSFLGTGAFTGTAGELRYYHNNGYTFMLGDTNGDGVGDFLIRLDGLLTLESGDFVL